MDLSFAPEDEAFLKNLVETGDYPSIEEAIRDAVRFLRKTDEYGSRKLYEALMLDERPIANRQYKPYIPALFKQIQRNVDKKAAARAPLEPDTIGEL